MLPRLAYSIALVGLILMASVKRSTAFCKSPSDMADMASERLSLAWSISSSVGTLFSSPHSGAASLSPSMTPSVSSSTSLSSDSSSIGLSGGSAEALCEVGGGVDVDF